MTRLFTCLLALLVFLSSSAMEGNADFWRSSFAAKGTPPVNVLPSSGNKFVVDPKGNVIPLKPGETLTRSPNGEWLQVRDANGNPTGMRLDGGHKPTTHPDPRAQVPHAHVPGVTNPDGTPWLPVNQ